MPHWKQLPDAIKQYVIVTANYWAFTLTDGALRMLVILHFHVLGYSPLQIALLFVFYEFFGVITNLLGGWLGARIGLNRTMNIGLALQVVALSMLLVPTEFLSVLWVMAAQAASGIAKDLNKMSAKSAIKLLVPDGEKNRLYTWVALLTGSKNTLKGVGFFLGGALLTLFGFRGAMLVMAIALTMVWLFSVISLKKELGKAGIAIALTFNLHAQTVLLTGLLLFGAVFAGNSSLHSFLIVNYANRDGVSLDVGFYYMANAMGRLLGTVLSGWIFQTHGLAMCLWVSSLFITLSALIALRLPR